MTPTIRTGEDRPLPVDPELLDLLVDGELSGEDYRQLLLQLESSPEGWRACALAFLEAQGWKKELGGLTSEQPSEPVLTPDSPQPAAIAAKPAKRAKAWRIGGTLAAMAASFLMALAVGSAVRDAWKGRGAVAPVDQLAQAPSPEAPAPVKQAPELPPVRAEQPGETPWRLVTVSRPGETADADSVVQLPAVEAEQLDDSWLRSGPDALTPEMRETLRRMGYRVQQRRELVPLPAQDGRRLVVPVDQVDLHYVGNRAFQ